MEKNFTFYACIFQHKSGIIKVHILTKGVNKIENINNNEGVKCSII